MTNVAQSTEYIRCMMLKYSNFRQWQPMTNDGTECKN